MLNEELHPETELETEADQAETVVPEKKPVIQFVTDDEQNHKKLIEIDEDEDPELEEPAEETQTTEKNGVDRLNDSLRSLLKPGTPTCAIIGGICGITAAVLCLTVGFWPTVLLGGFAGIGMWIGGAGEDSIPNRFRKLLKK